jgi:hypothetical protein
MRNVLALLGHEVSTKDEESWVYDVDINKHLHQFEMYLKFPDLKLPQHWVHIRYFLKKKSHPLHLYALWPGTYLKETMFLKVLIKTHYGGGRVVGRL